MDRVRAYGVLPVALIVVVAYVLIFGMPGGPAPASAADPSQVTQADAGRQLYLQSCAACHGPMGQGTAQGPSLIGVGSASADFMLRTGRMPLSPPADVTQHRAPAYGEADIQALDAYIGSLGSGPPIPNVVTSAADIPAGRALYDANCAQCHGPNGAGNAIGGDVTAPSLIQADPRTLVEAMRTGPNVMPVFAGTDIDDRGAAAIAAYVEYLEHAPSPGGVEPPLVGPVTEGFIAVVIGLGALILVLRWIAPSRTAPPGPEGSPTGSDEPA
jgi:ubiquinol-cytochrome c reductase cytochrome c subunit